MCAVRPNPTSKSGTDLLHFLLRSCKDVSFPIKIDPKKYANLINQTKKRDFIRVTMKLGRARVLAPADTAGGIEVLLDKMAALLMVIDALNAVAPLEALTYDLCGLDLDPLLANKVLPLLQHRHRVTIRIRRIEIVRRTLIELHLRLPHHLSDLFSSLPPLLQ